MSSVVHPGCSRSIVPLVYSLNGQPCLETESTCMHGDSCTFRLVLSYELSKLQQHMRLPSLPPVIRCSTSISHCIFCFRSSIDLMRVKNDIEGLSKMSLLYSDHVIVGGGPATATGFLPPILINPDGLSLYIYFHDSESRVLPSRTEAARILYHNAHGVDLPLYSVIIFSNCKNIYMVFSKNELEYITKI